MPFLPGSIFSEKENFGLRIDTILDSRFVKHTASRSLEHTAEDYLADLVVRHLLLPTKVKSLGRPKICSLIPAVRDFILSKVLDDNFLQIQSSKNLDFYSSSPTIYQHHRLRICLKWEGFVTSSGPFVRSLLFSPVYWEFLSHDSKDMSFIYTNFKFLRILNLEYIHIGESFIEVGVLVLLRYLAVSSSVNFIPPSIANLWNLETFLFKQWNGEVVKVPDCIWDMTKLRHIQIHYDPSFDLEPQRLENSSSILDNLQTFSKPTLVYGDKMEKILRRLPSIRKLSCVFLDSWDDATNCNRFPMLKFLNQLISLKVHYKGEGKYPCELNFPLNMKKLTLFGFRMPWNTLSQLAQLNNLEVLKLIEDAFEGERWDMEDHVVFPKLKYLNLKRMEVVEYWSATHDNFPSIEHLILEDCKKLVEIPKDFAYISSIRMIEVKSCTPSVENSIRLIQEQHVKCWGHDDLKIACDAYSSKCNCLNGCLSCGLFEFEDWEHVPFCPPL